MTVIRHKGKSVDFASIFLLSYNIGMIIIECGESDVNVVLCASDLSWIGEQSILSNSFNDTEQMNKLCKQVIDNLLCKRGVHRAGQNLPCSGQISRNTRCPGQGRFETWTGQVDVHMPPTFSRAKLCVLREEIFDFSNIFYGNNNHCTWRYEIVNEFAICLCDQATYTHKNIRNNNGRWTQRTCV